MRWLRMDENTSPGVIHARAAFLRGFARYQKAIGKHAFVLPDAYISGKRAFIPYLFTTDELSKLFAAIDVYECKTNPLRSRQFQTYFRLTYTCGLRPGEGRVLKREDVDLKTGEVRILNTKWHKSRTVVMSDDMLSLAKEYAAARDAVVLNKWLNEKHNLSSRLPYLQTYMGHKDIAATAYYIHLLPEQLVKNAGIDWDSMNAILPRCELWEK